MAAAATDSTGSTEWQYNRSSSGAADSWEMLLAQVLQVLGFPSMEDLPVGRVLLVSP
jgi:hypothetical protein